MQVEESMNSKQPIFNKSNIAPSSNLTVRDGELVTVIHDKATTGTNGDGFLTLKELMEQCFPDSEWVVRRLIPEGLTVLSAQPASFKTWLLLDIAICVASGKPLFNTFDTEQSGVLMVDEENSARLLQQRLQLLDNNNELPIRFMIEQDFKLDGPNVSKIIKFCKKNDIGLVTFDSLVRIHSSNENDAVAMSDVFAKIRKFTKANINVIVTHHNRKSGKTENPSQDMRGSSDILAVVDCHLSLKRDRESKRLTITQTKVRSSEEIEPIEIEVIVSEDNLRFEYLGTIELGETKRTKTTKAVKEILADSSELNQKDIFAKLEENNNKVNAKTLRSILQYMETNGELATLSGKGSEILYRLIK